MYVYVLIFNQFYVKGKVLHIPYHVYIQMLSQDYGGY